MFLPFEKFPRSVFRPRARCNQNRYACAWVSSADWLRSGGVGVWNSQSAGYPRARATRLRSSGVNSTRPVNRRESQDSDSPSRKANRNCEPCWRIAQARFKYFICKTSQRRRFKRRECFSQRQRALVKVTKRRERARRGANVQKSCAVSYCSEVDFRLFCSRRMESLVIVPCFTP